MCIRDRNLFGQHLKGIEYGFGLHSVKTDEYAGEGHGVGTFRAEARCHAFSQQDKIFFLSDPEGKGIVGFVCFDAKLQRFRAGDLLLVCEYLYICLLYTSQGGPSGRHTCVCHSFYVEGFRYPMSEGKG